MSDIKTILNPIPIGMTVGLTFGRRSGEGQYPSAKPVPAEWAVSMLAQVYPLNVNVCKFTTCGEEVGEARNHIVEEALKMRSKYLWFVDADTAPPKEAARVLMYLLEQSPDDVMVAGGIYCAKMNPTEPVVYRGHGSGAFWKWKVGEVFECTGIGTGCMMIKTEVFKHLEQPYFKTVHEIPENMKLANGAAVDSIQTTDDLYFCDKVTAAGFKIMAHGGVQCIHWDIETGTPYMLPQDSYPVIHALNTVRADGTKINSQVA
jgi:hypothetical protein